MNGEALHHRVPTGALGGSGRPAPLDRATELPAAPP